MNATKPKKKCTNCGRLLVEGAGIPYKGRRLVCDSICRDERDLVEKEIASIKREERRGPDAIDRKIDLLEKIL